MRGSIRRRSVTSWEIRVDLGTDSQGKRQRRYISVQGKRGDADRRLRELMATLDKGLPLDSGNITVAEYLERWLDLYAVPNTRPRTAEKYAGDIKNHIIPAVGHIKLTQLRPMDIQGLQAQLFDKGLSTRTVRHVHVLLKESLKRAIRWGLLYNNPADVVETPRPPRKEITPPDIAEVKALIKLASDTDYSPMLAFMARTGVRRGECLGLRWGDVALDAGTASIVQTLQRVGRVGLVFLPPKSAKSRRLIALDTQTVDMLRGHRGRQILLKAELGDMYRESGLVFPGPFGEPLDPATLTRNFEKIARKAGLGHVRLHDLRHFHATTLLRAGIHLKIVQERLGHASIAITADTYSHVAPSMQRTAADAFAEVMDGGSR